MPYDFRTRIAASINYHGWRITETYKPERRWWMVSSDCTLLITWGHNAVEISETTDDDELHERITEAKLADRLRDTDERLKLNEIEEQLEDQ